MYSPRVRDPPRGWSSGSQSIPGFSDSEDKMGVGRIFLQFPPQLGKMDIYGSGFPIVIIAPGQAEQLLTFQDKALMLGKGPSKMPGLVWNFFNHFGLNMKRCATSLLGISRSRLLSITRVILASSTAGREILGEVISEIWIPFYYQCAQLKLINFLWTAEFVCFRCGLVFNITPEGLKRYN